MAIKIYVGHHKPSYLIENDVFQPIQLGASFRSVPNGDDIGDSISHRNKEFCEMTGIYWAWKNDTESEWIGFMHYRRHLDFALVADKPDMYGCINVENLDAAAVANFGLHAEAVEKVIESNKSLKAILPTKWSVKNVGCKSIYEQYAKADFHNEDDLQIVRLVVQELSPDYLPHYDVAMADEEGYFTNIFVFRRDVFEEYCSWIYAILLEVDKRLDLTNYSTASRRAVAYIAERLMNVFVRKKHFKLDEVIELKRVFFKNTDSERGLVKNNLKINERANAITLVSASDDNFVPHLAALIESVKDNLSIDSRFDYYILDGGITDKNKKLLKSQFVHNLRQNGSLHFINCQDLYKNVPVHMHFAVPTFYRLDLAEIFKNHARVIYLDADMIVLHDLEELWNIDLEGKVLAAIPDVVMKSFVNANVLSSPETGAMPAKEYLMQYLEMGGGYDQYFQAGLLLVDVRQYAKFNISEKSRKDLSERVYWLVDQDLLNKYFLGKVKFLDTSWNCLNIIKDCKDVLGSMWLSKVVEDFQNPKIVHYAGYNAKPWNKPSAPWSDVYWFYLRKTFWYEAVIGRAKNSSGVLVAEDLLRERVFSFMRRVWLKLPYTFKYILMPIKRVILNFR